MARQGTTPYFRLDDFSSSRQPNQLSSAMELDRSHSPAHEDYGNEGRTSTRSSSQNLGTKPLPKPPVWHRPHIITAQTTSRFRKCVQAYRPRWMHLGGWRNTVRAGAAIAIGVMVMNVIILAWGLTRDLDPNTGQRLIARGTDCNSTQRISTYWHFAINVLSTLLLATSNAAMQCLSAPTREAADRAHACGSWVDIGISGLRNWPYMDGWRKWCYIALVASTLPLHLLYNSAIFSTDTANDYWALAVTPGFLTGAPFSIPDQTGFDTNFASDSVLAVPANSLLSDLSSMASQGSLVRLENKECISTYSQQMISQYSNVLMVSKTFNSSGNSSLLRYYPYTPTPAEFEYESSNYGPNWICGYASNPDVVATGCNFTYFIDEADAWNLTAFIDIPYSDPTNNTRYFAPPIDVDHCLAQPTTPFCTVQMAPVIMIVVVVANAVKVLCFISIVRITSFDPFVTLGDALASYMARPDPLTKDIGPLTAEEIRRALKRARSRDMQTRIRQRRLKAGKNYLEETWAHPGLRSDPLPGLPLELGPWRASRRRWFSGASWLRWSLTYVFMGSLWLGTFIFYLVFFARDGGDLAQQWSIGFGNVSPQYLVQGASDNLVLNSLFANLPQLGLSLAYISLNGLCTCILLSREFTLFAKHRISLRVSEPTNKYQRSTYWLSLPYKFSIPLMALSWALHWSLSQTLFIAEIIVQLPNGETDSSHTVNSIGYSGIALMIFVVVGGIGILAPLILGWTRYYEGAPLVESYSLAISAACHPPPNTIGMNPELLKYGALKTKHTGEEEQELSRWEFSTPGTHMPAEADAMLPQLSLAADNRERPNKYNALFSPTKDFSIHKSTHATANGSYEPVRFADPNISQDHSRPEVNSRSAFIATLASVPVQSLSSSHTYTPLRALTSVELSAFRVDPVPHPRFRRFLNWMLPFLALGKLAVCCTLLAFVTIFTDALAAIVAATITMVYEVARGGYRAHQFRQKHALIRRWWWHVFPEFVLFILWIIMTPTSLNYSYAEFGGYIEDNSAVWFIVPLAILFGICGIAELWFWTLYNPGLTRAVIKDLCSGRWRFPGKNALRE